MCACDLHDRHGQNQPVEPKKAATRLDEEHFFLDDPPRFTLGQGTTGMSARGLGFFTRWTSIGATYKNEYEQAS